MHSAPFFWLQSCSLKLPFPSQKLSILPCLCPSKRLFLMELIKEIMEQKFDMVNAQPHVYCKVFEDNSDTLELARLPRLRPCTNRGCNIKYSCKERKCTCMAHYFVLLQLPHHSLLVDIARPFFLHHQKNKCGSSQQINTFDSQMLSPGFSSLQFQ